jgi:hypothetical protein
MVGKKGFLRIFEAVLGAIVVIGFLILVIRNNPTESKNFESEGKVMLDEIAKNESLRAGVLDNRAGIKTELEEFTKKRLNNPAINFSMELCELNNTCFFSATYPANAREIYAVERIISTNTQSPVYNPKKLKIFIWER